MRATEIAQYLDANGYPPVNVKSLGKYGQRKWKTVTTIKVEDQDFNYLSDLMDDIEESGRRVGKIQISKRQTHIWERQADGTNKQVPKEVSAQVVEILPNDSDYEPATIAPINVSFSGSTKASKPSGFSLGVSVPDMQIGYFRGTRGELETIHDEAAINVLHQILLYLQETYGIDLIVNQGDNTDFPMFSSHRSAPGYMQTTQLTIDRVGTEAATQRAISPDSENVWLCGNHEARLTNTLTDRMPGLVGIARSNEEEPVISVPYLCKFDESKTTFLDGYPDAEYWANDGLRFVHGSLYSSTRGATANKYLSNAPVSTVFGHTHRGELVLANQSTKSGGYDYWAGTGGCLARVDGSVPSTKTGITSTGKQNIKPKTEDWTQGLIVIWYETNGTRSVPEPVYIEDGRTLFRGIEFVSTVDVNGKPIN